MIREIEAVITGSTQVGSQWRYAWKQVIPDLATGEHDDPLSAAKGTTTDNYALERNNAEVDADTRVFLRQYGIVAGQMVWVFTHTPEPAAASTASPWKTPVRCATTAALPACTYDNGTSGVGATLTATSNGALSAQDGVTLTAYSAANHESFHSILVKDEATGGRNGIYRVTQLGDASNPFILTRRTDADEQGDLVAGAMVAVMEGTVNADTTWLCTANYSGLNIGSTSLAWVLQSPVKLTTGTLGSIYNVSASGSWENTGLGATLPAAGNYLVVVTGSVSGNISAISGGSTSAQIDLSLYNTTTAVRSHSVTPVYLPNVNSLTAGFSATFPVFATGAETVRVEIQRSNTATWVASLIFSGARLTWFRLPG